jgi:uncharacterized protein YbgA (DUF1722 family)
MMSSCGGEDDKTVPHLMQRLHEELAATTRAKDELTIALATEKRSRRESEQHADEANCMLSETRVTVKGLQRTIDELRTRARATTTTGSYDTVIAPAHKTNDELLADIVRPTTGGNETADVMALKAMGLTSDDLRDPKFVTSLVTQRDALRSRVSAMEQSLAASEKEVERLGRLVADNAGVRETSVFDSRYRSTLLAAMPSSSSACLGVDTAAVSIENENVASKGLGGRRQRKIQQTVRRVADGVAVLVANMIVHSSMTRLFLVGYLVGLHVIVMLTTYIMAFRGTRSAAAVPALCPST